MSDLINRQQAIDVLEEQLDYLSMLNKKDNPTAESKWYGINWARNKIAELPTVEPKVGRWIPYKAYFGKKKDSWVDELKCSECGYGWGDKRYNYCPNCGAKMKGE